MKPIKWKSKWIYWHTPISIDKERVKESIKRKDPYKIGQLYGFTKRETHWQTYCSKERDIVPYITFKFIGRTLHSEDKNKRHKEFKAMEKQFKEKAKRAVKSLFRLPKWIILSFLFHQKLPLPPSIFSSMTRVSSWNLNKSLLSSCPNLSISGYFLNVILNHLLLKL